jgi:hypothetical protein
MLIPTLSSLLTENCLLPVVQFKELVDPLRIVAMIIVPSLADALSMDKMDNAGYVTIILFDRP